jgi:hypothetical protein
MSGDMTVKYQQHYNQFLSGTLSDLMMKNLTYQANIKLANEIIAEQEKTIAEKQSELEEIKNNKTISDNSIVTLLKTDFDNIKSHASNVEVFRNELIKERELHQQTKNDYEQIVSELKNKIALLETPPKKKKSNKNSTNQDESFVAETTVKDGGSF